MNLKFEIADISRLNDLFDAEKVCFPNEFWSFENIKGELCNNRNVCIIACNGNNLLGYMFFSMVCDECELNRIAVIPEYRNLKIGKMLMDKMIKHLEERSCKTVYLEVRSSNTSAINLYLKAGFKKIGFRKNYYKNPIEDAILMSLELN